MSPVYDETFEFGDIPSLNNMVLKVKIMDKDVGLDDEIGSCKIKLEKLHLTEMKSMEVVVDKKNEKHKKGFLASCVSCCNPCSCCCDILCGCFRMCCKAMFTHEAVIHLELKYADE